MTTLRINKKQLISITATEKIFLQLTATGLDYDDIAKKMKVSKRSVEGYKSMLFQKFDVHDKANLLIKALRLGYIQL
jgi:DNA-binding CsgD family transcriptional regulator